MSEAADCPHCDGDHPAEPSSPTAFLELYRKRYENSAEMSPTDMYALFAWAGCLIHRWSRAEVDRIDLADQLRNAHLAVRAIEIDVVGLRHELRQYTEGLPPVVTYAYRVVIDSYPTPDGRPFTEQDPDVWELVGTPEAPDWLPGAGAMHVWRTGPGQDWETGAYDPAFYSAPRLSKQQQRTFSRGTVRHRLARVLALGCEAHVERAPIGVPERIEVTPGYLPPEERGDGVPQPAWPGGEPPF